MTNRKVTDGSKRLPNELTPDEARKKRAYHLALARKNVDTGYAEDTHDADSTEPTTACFILPGD